MMMVIITTIICDDDGYEFFFMYQFVIYKCIHMFVYICIHTLDGLFIIYSHHILYYDSTLKFDDASMTSNHEFTGCVFLLF